MVLQFWTPKMTFWSQNLGGKINRIFSCLKPILVEFLSSMILVFVVIYDQMCQP